MVVKELTQSSFNLPDRPFGEIALTLSGGGYRATAFHLGTLSMLDELKLLDDVTRLSAISGGTILAAKYALERSINGTFNFSAFEQQVKSFISTTNVTAYAVANLTTTTQPNGLPLTPSLIRAAAQVYANKTFLGEATLGDLRNSKTGINEISLTATDFFTGTRFRFQYSHRRTGIRTGSSSGRLTEIQGDEVRLADIVAASSCFPGGFEPFYFPADFSWKRPISDIYKDFGTRFSEDIPLMDGGVIDNQGIDSIEKFIVRGDGSENLFIISDSSPRSDKLYEGDSKKSRVPVPVWSIIIAIILLFVISAATIGVLGYEAVTALQHGTLSLGRAVTNYLFPLLSALVVFVVISIAAGAFIYYRKDAEIQIGGAKGWGHFLRLDAGDVYKFVRSRIKSVLAMTTDVFMGRIRSLSYTSVYSNDKLRPWTLSNLIYDLDDEKLWRSKVPQTSFPNAEIRKIVCDAEAYPTTLNFDSHQASMDQLIQAGRATICFNLLRYLIHVRKVNGTNPSHPLHQTFQNIEAAWIRVNI